MATKTLGAILIAIACILMIPIGIGIIGGVFGIVFGVIGAVFGIIGGVFGAIFGVFGWIFEGPLNWDCNFGFFPFDTFSIILLIIVAVLLSRKRSTR